MRKKLALIAVLVVGLLCSGFVLETHRGNVQQMRTAVTGSDVTLADWSWSGRPSHTMQIPRKWNELVFSFKASGAAGDTASGVEIYGYCQGHSAQLFWKGDLTAGAALHDDGDNFADTITTDTDEDHAPGGVEILNGEGNDQVATLRMDFRECEYVMVLMPTVSAGNWDVCVVGD